MCAEPDLNQSIIAIWKRQDCVHFTVSVILIVAQTASQMFDVYPKVMFHKAFEKESQVLQITLEADLIRTDDGCCQRWICQMSFRDVCGSGYGTE